MTTLADLPHILREAHYERDGVARIIGITPADRNVELTAAEELMRSPSAAHTLTRVFYMARPALRNELAAALTPALCDLLIQEGILVADDAGRMHATCAIVPARDFIGLRDFDCWATGKPLPEDHVLGVGLATTLLADFTVRHIGENVLDIGTGQGYQAAMAARHAKAVIATDINARALTLAGLAMRINGISSVDFRQGSFFEPVAGEKQSFDLIVSNPPFVIAPPHDVMAFGGRWIGDSIVENLITTAPDYLRDGGWATIICNWHHPTPADWSPRPTAWVTRPGIDAWIVKLKTEDPRTYAANWLRNWLRQSAASQTDSAMTEALSRLRDWLEYYRSIDVGAISLGVVYLHKRTATAGAPANWVRTDALSLDACKGAAGDQVQRIFAGETLLRGLHKPDDLLDHRLALCPTAELVQRHSATAGTWQASESSLRQSQGFEFPIALGALPARILAALQGKSPARPVIADIARSIKADPAVAFAQTAPFLADVMRQGYLSARSA